MRFTRWFPAAMLALFLAGGGLSQADTGKKATREDSSFGSLKSADPAEARKQAEAWLKAAGKTDAASLEKFKSIWEGDRTLLEKVTATLILGDAEAARLLASASNPDAPAPTAIPAVLKDAKKSAFYRHNLTLAYGRALVGRKVYEEALEALATLKPEEVADPASYFFHRAVCEYALMLKDRADGSIDRLLVDVTDAPERYRMVAALMHFDMLTWQEKDLGWIARKMDNIQRRLALQRGGKQTQKMQKEVLVRLDEMIKEIENRQKPPGGGDGDDPNNHNCPPGGPRPGNEDGPGREISNGPARDTIASSANGSGQVETKRVKEIAEVWGKLPEKERAQALRELTRTMPAKDRAVIEAYFKELQKKSGK